jgi:hypothetical protein
MILLARWFYKLQMARREPDTHCLLAIHPVTRVGSHKAIVSVRLPLCFEVLSEAPLRSVVNKQEALGRNHRRSVAR